MNWRKLWVVIYFISALAFFGSLIAGTLVGPQKVELVMCMAIVGCGASLAFKYAFGLRDKPIKTLPEQCPQGSEISQDKALEFMQVAALVCLDLDLLAEVAEDDDLTVDELRKQIKYVAGKKDKIIADPVERQQRYGAGCAIFGAVNAGMVQCRPLSK